MEKARIRFRQHELLTDVAILECLDCGAAVLLTDGGAAGQHHMDWHDRQYERAEGEYFEVYPDVEGVYRWRLKDGNRKITAGSYESFASEANARRAATQVLNRPIKVLDDNGKVVTEHQKVKPVSETPPTAAAVAIAGLPTEDDDDGTLPPPKGGPKNR